MKTLNQIALGTFLALGLGLAAAQSARASDAPLMITNAEGLTVYTFDKDAPNASNCYDGCARAWPPVLSATKEVGPNLSTTVRKDGTLQVTYQGKPLYLYVGDEKAGDKTGDGLGGVWHIARP
jgi:predicted lipoprotein with Yx(FWY)xxD motif